MDQVITATGDSGTLTVTPTAVTVRTGGRERVIPMTQIATATLQHPGLGTGYLHVVLYNDPRPERVLAEWVEDGEAVVFRSAQYPEFATAKDFIERYRPALPPDAAGANPFPGITPPTASLPWEQPAPSPTPDPLAGLTPPSASPPWQAPSPPPASPEWGGTIQSTPPAAGPEPFAQPGTSGAGSGPVIPPGMPGSEAAQELLSEYPEPVQRFAREHPEAVQEFLANPQQFMREHPEVVREFLLAQRAQRLAGAGRGASAGGGSGVGAMPGAGMSTGTADVPARRRGRGCLTGCLVVILIVVVLGFANAPRVMSFVRAHLTPTPSGSLIRFAAADLIWNQSHTPDAAPVYGTTLGRGVVFQYRRTQPAAALGGTSSATRTAGST